MKKSSRIILIDAHALCYRAFYAVKELRNSKGEPTNAVFGFVNILRKLLKDQAPAYMAVCFDVSKKTRRQAKYADYKIHRPSMPEDLSRQIPVIQQVIRAYRIPIFAEEGFEADDILATLTERFHKEGCEVVIVSDDKDMYQLIGDGVGIYSSRQDRVVGVAETKEKLGVLPHQVVDYLALAGDASDNIPGVDGIGEVTARNLLQEYGSLDAVLEHAQELKGKLKDRVSLGREVALLSRELATLDRAVPIECSLEDIRVQPPDNAKLAQLFTDLEFRGFLKGLETKEDASSAQIEGSEHEKIVVPAVKRLTPAHEKSVEAPVASGVVVDIGEVSDDAAAFVREAKKAGAFAFYLDTNEEADLFDKGAYGCVGGKVYRLASDDLKKTGSVFADKNILKIFYGYKDLLSTLDGQGAVVNGEVLDILLAAYLLGAGLFSYDIEALAWQYLKRSIPEDDRALHVVRTLFDLAEPLRQDLKDKGALDLYQNVELPLTSTLYAMEQEGVRIDVKFLEGLSQEGEKKIAEMTKRLYTLAGEEFNLNSPKQLGKILFEKLELPVGRKTKTGYSTDEEVLTKLATKHELPQLLLEYRQLAKLKSTYIDALPRMVDSKTGRVHCSFNQTGAETGRLSSNHPNLQNIPIRTEMGREIRKAFVPSEGNALLSADYSQIELRVLAHLADEPNLKKAFASGEDIHCYTAGLMFDVKPAEVTQEMRYGAKRINFGIIYGMSAFGLAKDLGVPQREAQAFIDRYFLRYPGIQTFMDAEIKKARELGYSETLFKRRRYFPDISSRNPGVRQFAERQAVNTPVQGSAADLIKMAMVKITDELEKAGLKSRMIITVHDELVFDVPKGEVPKAARVVKETMEHVLRLSVPLDVTVKCGMNWAEMKAV